LFNDRNMLWFSADYAFDQSNFYFLFHN